MTSDQPEQTLIEEFAVVDDSCQCRRTCRSLEAAQRILATGRLMPGREPGPLRLEKRLVTAWEPV